MTQAEPIGVNEEIIFIGLLVFIAMFFCIVWLIHRISEPWDLEPRSDESGETDGGGDAVPNVIDLL